MFSNKEKRFKIKHKEGMRFGEIQIIVDTMTGVHYIVTVGSSYGITPLLDENGNIVIKK